MVAGDHLCERPIDVLRRQLLLLLQAQNVFGLDFGHRELKSTGIGVGFVDIHKVMAQRILAVFLESEFNAL